MADGFELDADVVKDSPFVASGSVDQIVDTGKRLREQAGVMHYVVRDAERFVPIVEVLTGQ